MKKTMLCVMVAAAVCAGPAEAIFKCTTAKGVVYQDRPCREGSETDVQVVIPTGEIAPKTLSTQDEDTQANASRAENRAGTSAQGRTSSDNPAAGTRSSDRRSANAGAANASDDARKKDTRASAANSTVPMTPEQARNTEPTAKYYTTDVTSSGSNTPEQMTCESPTGEKRRFILTNGKLTSI